MIHTQQLHWHHLLIYVAFLPFSVFLTLLLQEQPVPFHRISEFYSSSSAIPGMVNHVCTSELSADLGRSFSKRKNYGGNFHSWNSHLTSSQHSNRAPASPYVDAAGRDGFVLLCQTRCFQKPLAVSGGGHSWIQSSLLLRFLQEELHTASILTISRFYYLTHSCITHGYIPAFVPCHIALHSIPPSSQSVKEVRAQVNICSNSVTQVGQRAGR